MIDSVLCDVSAHLVCHRFQLLRSICHSDTGSNGLQHFDVVIAVPESNRFFRLKVIIFQQLFDCDSFSAVCRNNIDRPVPPCRNF